MDNVYKTDVYGNWIDIKPITDQPGEHKRCPNCRAPIKNIHRYGRITKKCVLDTQNKKFLQLYSHQVKNIRAELEKTIGDLERNRGRILEEMKKPNVRQIRKNDDDDRETLNKERDDAINRVVSEVFPQRKHEMLEKHYSIPAYHEELWCNHVTRLLTNYSKVALIISNSTNPPYKLAYEAAVSSL